jgi:hypothetical protein
MFLANIAENECGRAFCSTPQTIGSSSDRKYNNAEFHSFSAILSLTSREHFHLPEVQVKEARYLIAV